MSKRMLCILFTVLLAVISACSGQSSANLTLTPDAITTPYIEGQTPCDHPYFPLRLGAYWRYRFSITSCDGNCEDVKVRPGAEVEVSWQVIDVQSDAYGTRGTMLLQSFDEITSTFDFLCDNTGVRFLRYSGIYDHSNTHQPCDCFSFAPDRMGICPPWSFLPPARSLVQGYSWQGRMEGYRGSMGGVDFWSEYEVVATEMVNVTGQEYNGLQVTRVANCDLLSGFGPHLGSQKNTVYRMDTTTIELARGVGVLRMTMNISSTTSIEDRYTLDPTVITLIAELTEFDIVP